MVNKFKEILFLKNLKSVGKSTIYGKYWDLLNDAEDLNDLVLRIKQKESKFTENDLLKAKSDAEELYDYISNSNIQIITVFDDNYPKKLEVMENKRPLILYVKGNAEALTKPNISVIGTRKPSQLSQDFEADLVKNIVKMSDKVIVSGLALGCDKIAHQTTIDENGVTIAFLPSGINNIKPATNKKLAENIIKTGGCLVSEYELDKGVFKSTYVERDQIIAAFSDAVFVVECSVESGTMHTVNFANEYKRQIYSYLPTERPEDLYDGNEFILKNKSDSIKVEDIDEFINDLKTIKIKSKPKSVQMTFD